MARISNSEPTKFYSLFVPQIDWFQTLLARRAMEGSLSDYLLDLVVRDLRAKKILTKKESDLYNEYADQKPAITKTRFTKEKVHSTFSLYLPKKEGQEWVREKLDKDFLKKECGAKSRSLYVWDLFVKENEKQLTKSQLKEWEKEKAPKGKSA